MFSACSPTSAPGARSLWGLLLLSLSAQGACDDGRVPRLDDPLEEAQDTGVADAALPPMEAPARVTQLAAGDSQTCALLDTGHVECWGRRFVELYGPGTSRPTRVEGLEGVVQITTGGMMYRRAHACAVTGAGEVWCWGDDEYGAMPSRRRGRGSSPSPPVWRRSRR